MLQPIRRADTQEQRHILRNQLPRQFNQLKGQADAILKTSTVLIRPMVRGRGDEVVEKIPMPCTLHASALRHITRDLHTNIYHTESNPNHYGPRSHPPPPSPPSPHSSPTPSSTPQSPPSPSPSASATSHYTSPHWAPTHPRASHSPPR